MTAVAGCLAVFAELAPAVRNLLALAVALPYSRWRSPPCRAGHAGAAEPLAGITRIRYRSRPLLRAGSGAGGPTGRQPVGGGSTGRIHPGTRRSGGRLGAVFKMGGARSGSRQADLATALRLFERNRGACGPPGPYAEEYDVSSRQLRGNLPRNSRTACCWSRQPGSP